MARSLDAVADTLAKAGNVLVATHVFPDGDALGSQLALGDILESLGKRVFLYSEENVSHLYDFLPGCEKLQTTLPALDAFDCAVALDCGDRQRLGRNMDRLLEVHPFVMIDHHAGNIPFGDLGWVEPGRASTGELVFDLATALGAEISFDAAYCLFSAIVSDTGSFKYSSTTVDTFRVAGELIAKGVDPSDVAGKLFDNFTVNRLSLLRMVLDTLKLHADSRIAVVSVTEEMLQQTGTTRADTENFINYPRSLVTVKAAAFIKEAGDGVISVSLRSKGDDCDVAKVAAKFGGGGHRNAAGFRVNKGTIAEVGDRLLQELLPMVNG